MTFRFQEEKYSGHLPSTFSDVKSLQQFEGLAETFSFC
jgi:hypothetical protein